MEGSLELKRASLEGDGDPCPGLKAEEILELD